MYFKDIETSRAGKLTHDKNQKSNARKRLDDVAAKLKLKHQRQNS